MAKKELKLNYNTFATTHSRDYYRGQSFHFSGEWLVGAHYLSDDYNVDFVVHDQVLLACAKSHLSTTENEPKDFIRDESGTVVGVVSTYWDFVLSGIVGNSPGIKIVDNYWYICANIGVPEEEQIWINTGVKAKMELSDLTPADIELLQRPGKEVVTEFVNTTITQELGNDPTKILSQAGVTTALNTKASLAQLNAAIQNEVLRANNTYQSKGDYATNTRVNELESAITDLEDDITDDIDDINDAISDIQSDIDTLEGNIPTKVSQLENDSKYQTKTNLDNALSPITAVIPEQANALNKLADKNYVDTIAAGKLDTSLKGANNGLAELDENGLIPSSQLPAFVDDILEYSSVSLFPQTGESGKIYVDTTTNLTYRWSGSQYIEISESLALGETSSTAYRGDRGKTAYDHATDSNKVSSATANGFYKVGATAEGHIANLVAVTKADITGFNLNKSDVGLSNVDNTSDANKPVSTATQTELDKKLEGVQVDGTDLTVTNQKVNIDLSGKVDVAESAVVDDEFLFRPTGNNLTIDAKNAELQEVNGHSVAWNQQIADVYKNKSVSYDNSEGTSRYYFGLGINIPHYTNVINGHKIFAKAVLVNDGGDVDAVISVYINDSVQTNLLGSNIFTANTSSSAARDVVAAIVPGKNLAGKVTIQFIDLTLLGIDSYTTVEQVEAWLAKNVGLRSYYPYNAGTILNNKMTAIENVGFNQWDDEWEIGTIDVQTGQNSPLTTRIRTKNYIPVLSSETYYYRNSGQDTNNPTASDIHYYDAAKNWLGRSGSFRLNEEFTVPAGTAYVRFVLSSQYGTTYNHDICINISNSSKNGTYEPYKKHTEYVDVTHIYGKLNGAGNLVQVFPDGMLSAGSVKDTLKVENGEVVAKKNIGSVDLGTLNYTYNPSAAVLKFIAPVSGIKRPANWNATPNITSGRYIPTFPNNLYASSAVQSTGFITVPMNTEDIAITNTSYSDTTAFAIAMSGVYLNYELETPSTYTNLVYQNSSYFADNTLVTLPDLYPIDKYGTEYIVPQGLDTNDNIITCSPNLKINYREANIKTNEIEGIEYYDNKIEKIQIDGTDQTIVNKTVNLPAYPTTLPASDVSDWAKAANKPSYNLDEVSDGDTRKLSNYKTIDSLKSKGTSSVPVYFDASGDAQSITNLALDGSLSGNAFKVIAEHITRLTSRLDTLESSLNALGDVTVKSLDVRKDILHNGSKLILVGSGAPTTVPDFVGQFYIDITNKKLYFAVSTSAVSSWTVC